MLDWLRYRYQLARVHREWRRIAANVAQNNSEKSSRWSFLNKPFTLWLLSAVVIGVWSTYHSTSQQCHEQADKVYADIIPPLNELSGRLRELRQNVDSQRSDYDAVVDKIFRGEMGFQSPAYKDNSLVTVLSSYNAAARYIAAERLPEMRIVGNSTQHPVGVLVENTRHDLSLNLITVGLLDNSHKLSSEAPQIIDRYINSDMIQLEERRFLLFFGNKFYNCSLMMQSFWQNLLFGYSDAPKLGLDYALRGYGYYN
jgi:hypothetical protein